MAQDTDAFFSVDFGSGDKLRFGSIDEIERWLQDQRSAWGWLLDNRGQNIGPQLNQLRSKYFEVYQQFSGLVAQLKQSPTNQNAANNLRNLFGTAYGPNSTVLLAHHPFAEIGRTIATTSGQLAGAAALAYLLKINAEFPSSESVAIGGIVEAILARDGISKGAPSIVTDAINKSVMEQQERSLRQDSEFQTRKSAIDDFLNHSKTEFEHQVKALSDRWGELSTRVNSEFQASQNSIKNTEAAYTEQMQLQASVSYWTNQAASQAQSSRIFLGVLSIFIVIVGFGSYAILKTYIPVLASISISAEPHIWAISATLTLLASTVVFWAARVIVRLYLSAYHLATDAQERVVMIKTFLALIKEEKLDPAERSLVLAPLFRSSADGIIKDEGGPDLSAAAIFSRLLAGK